MADSLAADADGHEPVDARSVAGPNAVSAKPNRPELRLFRPANQALALGLAVNHLMTKPAFANLRFGDWSRILVGQINRNHYCFVVDASDKVAGFLGWAVTTKLKAEAWVEGRGGLSSEDAMGGDCIVFNAWSGGTSQVNRLLLAAAREVIKDKDTVYYKRRYRNGTNRPVRLTVNEFVGRHLNRHPP